MKRPSARVKLLTAAQAGVTPSTVVLTFEERYLTCADWPASGATWATSVTWADEVGASPTRSGENQGIKARDLELLTRGG